VDALTDGSARGGRLIDRPSYLPGRAGLDLINRKISKTPADLSSMNRCILLILKLDYVSADSISIHGSSLFSWHPLIH
jgi:hypothetical protein